MGEVKLLAQLKNGLYLAELAVSATPFVAVDILTIDGADSRTTPNIILSTIFWQVHDSKGTKSPGNKIENLPTTFPPMQTHCHY